MLAQRAYVYSLMHVVFGGALTAESAEKVFSAQTQEALGYVRDAMACDEYTAIRMRKLGSDGRSLSECVDEAYACVAKTEESSASDGLLETLHADYARLFQIPGDAYVHPWESPYVGKESMLFQESTLDVRGFYHEAGFKLQAEKHFPDDHVAAMMDYMARMAGRAFEAYADGKDDEAARTLATSYDFVQKHILTWVDAFASKVVDNDMHAYYAAFAGCMAAFARTDAAWVSLALAKQEDGVELRGICPSV